MAPRRRRPPPPRQTTADDASSAAASHAAPTPTRAPPLPSSAASPDVRTTNPQPAPCPQRPTKAHLPPPHPIIMPPQTRPLYQHTYWSGFRLLGIPEDAFSVFRIYGPGPPTRPRYPPPMNVDESDSKRPEEDQQKATPNPRPSPAQYTEEDQQTPTPDPGPSPAQYTREDQPAPQQTPTPNFFYAGLEKTFAEHKLDMAKRRKELLETAKLEESSITNASSSSLPQSPLRKELLDTTKLEESSITNASSFSLPQPTPSKELLDTTTPVESSIASASSSSLPQSPSRKELLETAKLEESSITNASSSSSSLPQSPSGKELLDTTKLGESSITNASSFSLPQPTSREDREPNVSLLNELLDTATLKESSITNVSSCSMPQSPLCEAPNTLELELNTTPSLSSCVSSLSPTGLLIKYFVRVDKGGLFHTYPNRGGPFNNLQEAQEAIDSYHVVERNNMCMDGLSSQERAVRNALYWHHNGTRKNSAEAFAAMATYRPEREVVKALLDKYNEESIPSGDPSYELKDIVRYEPCFDGKGSDYRSYSHLNMTVKTKGADDSTCANNKLFFAEVTCVIDEHEEYLLTCFCTVEHDDKGSCNVCGDEMKHPVNAEYKHGRPMSPIRRCCSYADADDLYAELVTVRDEAWLKAEEARVRRMIKEAEEAFEKDNKQFQARVRRMFKEVDEALEKDNKYVVPARRQKKVQASG